MKLTCAKSFTLFLIFLCFLTSYSFSASNEMLVSNYTFSATNAEKGSIAVFSRGDAGGGFAKISLTETDGSPRVMASELFILENNTEYTSVHDGILSETYAERLRTPMIYAGKLGNVTPMYGIDSVGYFKNPVGFMSLRNTKTNELNSILLDSKNITYADTNLTPMDKNISGFAFDSLNQILWIARGFDGLTSYDFSKGLGSVSETQFYFNKKNKTLDSLKNGMTLKKDEAPAILSIAIHPKTKELYLATTQGLWKESAENAKKFTAVKNLENKKITGLWIGGTPTQIIAETFSKSKNSIQNKLWRSYNNKDMAEVVFKDTAGTVAENVYDKADYALTSVSFIGNKAFLCVRSIGGNTSGLLKLDSAQAIPFESETQWLYNFEAGLTNRNTPILSVGDFLFPSGSKGLVITTYGNGVSVSADSGATWTPVLNQAAVGKNLSKIRMVPSVITADGESLIAYNLSKDSKITIEVFSYDMHKVRTIVKDVFRKASAGRSTEPKEDIFDGRDDHGRALTMGIYYVRVKDNHGHVGWGKVMTLGGN